MKMRKCICIDFRELSYYIYFPKFGCCGAHQEVFEDNEISGILIILPAYNVAGAIGKTLADIQRVVSQDTTIVVVDDGSTDVTAKEIGEFDNVVLLQHRHNLGKGAALKTGFQYGIEREFSHAIVLDADFQHDPNQIPAFMRAMTVWNYDLVVGTRDVSLKSMPADRYLSNKLSSLLLSLIARKRIRDSQCGFRLINLEYLKKLNLLSDHYEIESELLIKFARTNARIGQIPIRTVHSNGSSHIRRGLDSLRFFQMLWKTVIHGN